MVANTENRNAKVYPAFTGQVCTSAAKPDQSIVQQCNIDPLGNKELSDVI